MTVAQREPLAREAQPEQPENVDQQDQQVNLASQDPQGNPAKMVLDSPKEPSSS